MGTKIKKIGVFTSGGDAPGMNACLRAVTRSAIHHGLEVVGFRAGYDGIINNDSISMELGSVANIIHRGGTILKSARSAAFRTKEGREKAKQTIDTLGIDALIAIGGDGTFTGAGVFFQETGVPIIGVPGTIDNDLYGTDNTIGYDTALNTVVEALDKIRDTAESHDRLFFVEVMGRDAGFIALRSAIAGGAIGVMVPETKSDEKDLLEKLDRGWERERKSMIVVVAEGDELGGAFQLAKIVREKRPQYDTKVTVLGHVQRGGNPSCMDRVLASRLGDGAIDALIAGEQDKMVGLMNREIKLTPFSNAIKHNKGLNQDLMDLMEVLSI